MSQILTDQDFANAKRDISDIDKAVNTKSIVDPRWGGDFKSLPLVSEEWDAKTQDAQNTINDWQEAITEITVNDGVPALAVSTANGSNQQAVNDLGGVDYWAARSYQTNNEVRLANGDIVKSIIPNNTNDPNTDMTGWVKTNAATQIFDASGLNQQKINDLTVTPYHFGGIGDGLNHPLSERYATLAEAQAVYPFTEDLTDSIDYCALRSFFDYCQANPVSNPNITFNAYLHKSLDLSGSFRTTTYYGNLTIRNTQTDTEIEYLLRINVINFRILGAVSARGTLDNVASRKQLGGIIIGDGGTDGSAGRCFIDTIYTEGFRDFGLLLVNDSIFPSFRYNYNSNIGSYGGTPSASSRNRHAATFTDRVENASFANSQYTELTVDSLPPRTLNKHGFKNPVMVEHDGEIYRVTGIFPDTNKIRVYPCLNFKSEVADISYIYGMGCGWSGNNAGCGNFGTIQSMLCGVGFWGTSLYGGTIGQAISEFCGVGFTVSGSGDNVISYVVVNSYFEGNRFNLVQQWQNQSHRNLVRFLGGHAIDIEKSADLFNYRVNIYEAATGGRRRNEMTMTNLYIDGEDYSSQKFSSYKNDMTTSADLLLISGSGSIALSINTTKVKRFGIDRRLLVIAPHSSQITLTVPSAWTLAGASATLEPTSDHTLVYANIDWITMKVTLSYSSPVEKAKKGTTAQRPTTPQLGQRYYDTTLLPDGKPIEWNGLAWVDAAGVVV